MISGTYKFFRSTGVTGFMRDGGDTTAGTDAFNAVSAWAASRPGRQFEKLEISDDHMIATLSFNDSDSDAARDLDHQSTLLGVAREFAPS